MILLKAATVALNVAFAGFVTLLVTKAVSAWQNYTQRVENAVKQSQEAVQKANQLKSSLRDVVDGKLQINNDRYADLIAAQYTEAEVTAIEQAVNELNALQKEDTKEKTEGLTTATEEQQTALENAIPAIKDATVATGDLAVALAAAQGAAEGDDAMQAKIEIIEKALNARLTAINTNMQAALNSGAAVRNQLKGFDKDSKKSGKTSSKSVTDVASAFDTLTKAMKEYNQYGYISADTMKSMMKLEDKFTSCLVKNGDKLEINANEFRKLVETQLKQEEASGKASKSADELKRILSYLDSNVHSSTISFEQLTDVIKGYGTAMDEAKEKTDAIKSAFSGLSEVMNNKTDRNNPFGLLDSDDVEKQHEALCSLPRIQTYSRARRTILKPEKLISTARHLRILLLNI